MATLGYRIPYFVAKKTFKTRKKAPYRLPEGMSRRFPGYGIVLDKSDLKLRITVIFKGLPRWRRCDWSGRCWHNRIKWHPCLCRPLLGDGRRPGLLDLLKGVTVVFYCIIWIKTFPGNVNVFKFDWKLGGNILDLKIWSVKPAKTKNPELTIILDFFCLCCLF